MKSTLIMNLSDYEFQVLKTTLESSAMEFTAAIEDGITEERNKDDIKSFTSHLSAIKTILEQMGERK